jgi:hypothetical protein
VTARPLTYGDGIGTGIAVLAIAGACYLATASVELTRMYADFGSVTLPPITHVVLHPAWIYGVPLALVGAMIGVHLRRPRFAFLAIAGMAIAVDVFWYVAAWAPINALAGSIQ